MNYLLTVLLAVVLAQGEAAAPPAEAQPAPAVKLLVSPAPEPRPALKCRLLPAAPEQERGSAALSYAHACILASHVPEDLDKDIRELLAAPLAALPVPKAEAILQAFGQALQAAEEGARQGQCDWELRLDQGLDLPLPELAQVRRVVRVLALRARVQASQGALDEALGTIRTGLKVARDVAQAPVLIHSLVAMAAAEDMLSALEQVMQCPGAPNLYWALAALPEPLVDLGPSLETEAALVGIQWPALRNVERIQLADEVWAELARQVASDLRRLTEEEAAETAPAEADLEAYVDQAYPAAKEYLAARGWPEEQTQSMPKAQAFLLFAVGSYESARDDVFKWQYVPYWRAREGLLAAEASAEKMASPLKGLLPAVTRVVLRARQLERHVAALQCVEAARMGAAATQGQWPEALADVAAAPAPLDPLTGQPFGYECAGDTAVLTAAPADPGRPETALRYEVTLRR